MKERTAAALVLALLAACGSGKPAARRTPAPSTATPPATSAPATTAPATSAKPGTQTITVTPREHLRNGQTVHVVGHGFTPNESLAVTECADKGDATGEGDCDIGGAKFVYSDAHGSVTADLTVTAGPFGSNGVSCARTQPCLVSVSQAALNPTEVATVRISFA